MEDSFEKFVAEFIEEVLNEMAFSGISDEEKQQLRELIWNRLDKRISAMLFEHLPEEEFQKLTAKLAEKEWTEEEQQAIFSQAATTIDDFESKLAETFYELKKELMEDAEELKNL